MQPSLCEYELTKTFFFFKYCAAAARLHITSVSICEDLRPRVAPGMLFNHCWSYFSPFLFFPHRIIKESFSQAACHDVAFRYLEEQLKIKKTIDQTGARLCSMNYHVVFNNFKEQRVKCSVLAHSHKLYIFSFKHNQKILAFQENQGGISSHFPPKSIESRNRIDSTALLSAVCLYTKATAEPNDEQTNNSDRLEQLMQIRLSLLFEDCHSK